MSACVLVFVTLLSVGVGLADDPPRKIRVATFNVSLVGREPKEIAETLRSGDDPKARAIAEIIQRVDPDILLINELDYDDENLAIERFAANYLAVGQNVSNSPAGPGKPISFRYRYVAPVNTGLASGCDLDNDGTIALEPGTSEYARDAIGYGAYPGQYGMLLLSKLPIDAAGARTFQSFLWRDMPGALLPDREDTAEPGDWYSAKALSKLRLSSKSHWDVPVQVGDETIRMLVSHPTPPVFDGPEDRNGRRNHDEIRFWADYVTPDKSSYIYDDRGVRGGLPLAARFVILGDLNADPSDGSPRRPIELLLANPRVNGRTAPESRGAVEAATEGANLQHAGNPACDTGDFPDHEDGPGNLRCDYVLPSSSCRISDSGVFWPEERDPLFALVGRFPFASSDHRLVWVDLHVDPQPAE